MAGVGTFWAELDVGVGVLDVDGATLEGEGTS